MNVSLDLHLQVGTSHHECVLTDYGLHTLNPPTMVSRCEKCFRQEIKLLDVPPVGRARKVEHY